MTDYLARPPEDSSARPSKGFLMSSRSCLAAVIMTMMAVFTPFQYAHSQSNPGETFSLTLKNVAIRSLIETVSLQTGKNFIVDPRVKGTVTVITSEPVNGDKLYELFLSVLDVHGYAAVPAGHFTKIVPMATGIQSAVPVLRDQTTAADELTTEVIQLEYVAAEQMIDSLRPLLPDTAKISAEPNSNTIIITDRAANIARLKRIIHLLDG